MVDTARYGRTPEIQVKPLAGIRVLDLSRLLPGPLCTQHLGDLGADVIKIEDLQRGDYARPALRRLVNRNKRAMRIDLRHPQGKALFERLARRADVIVDGFRPGVMERLGLGYDTLRAINPRLVYCAITGFGQDGPNRDRPGHDLNYSSLAGVTYEIGRAGEAPALSGFLTGDILGTLLATSGILAALVDAQRTGRGRFVDVAMADGVLAHNVLALAQYIESAAPPERGRGAYTGKFPRYGVYRTEDDRFIAVAAQERRFWDELCDVLGVPELRERHDVASADDPSIERRLAEIFARHPLAHWERVLSERETCASPVLTIEDALAHPQFTARNMVQRDPEGKPRFAFPIKMSDFVFSVDHEPPTPGEHTEEILRESGLGTDEIAKLRVAAAIA